VANKDCVRKDVGFGLRRWETDIHNEKVTLWHRKTTHTLIRTLPSPEMAVAIPQMMGRYMRVSCKLNFLHRNR